MDKFSKPYEYEEEKGTSGMLLILFFMLISLEPLIGILSISAFNDVAKGTLVTLIPYVTAVFILFSLFSGICLKRVSKYAIQVIKVFLAFRLLYLVPVFYFDMQTKIDAIPYEKTNVQYATEYNGVMTFFSLSILYVLVFSVFWYIYLIKSKNVKQNFPQKAKDPAAGA